MCVRVCVYVHVYCTCTLYMYVAHALGWLHISVHQLFAMYKVQPQGKLVGPADHMISRVPILVFIHTRFVQH